jgi:uncharacterized protein
MKLSKNERLQLINQYRILAALYKEDKDHYNELISILENGYEIFYSKLDEWVSDDMPSEEGQFVLDILSLYRAIDNLKRAADSAALTDHFYSMFRGFDGNNETKYMGFARFLIEEQGKFSEQEEYLFQNDHLNSHTPMVEKYQRMLNTVAVSKINIWKMSVEEALRILEA